jgi:plasmid stability protein
MTQLTIRRLAPCVIEALKKRANAAGRSMEEEARTILSDAVLDRQLAHQRSWVKQMRAEQKRLFGGRIFPDSTSLIRKMRDERSRRRTETWTSKTKT